MKEKWLSLSPAQKFVSKSIICVVAWRLLYVYVLEPLRFPDKILTRIIGGGAAFFINLFGKSTVKKAYCIENIYGGQGEALLVRNNHTILRIGDACNGLELMLIYAGVIILLPGTTQKKSLYVFLGFIGLLIVNMMRCAGLEWVYEFYRPMFETTHHYLFTLVMYVMIFGGWALYINKGLDDAKR